LSFQSLPFLAPFSIPVPPFPSGRSLRSFPSWRNLVDFRRLRCRRGSFLGGSGRNFSPLFSVFTWCILSELFRISTEAIPVPCPCVFAHSKGLGLQEIYPDPSFYFPPLVVFLRSWFCSIAGTTFPTSMDGASAFVTPCSFARFSPFHADCGKVQRNHFCPGLPHNTRKWLSFFQTVRLKKKGPAPVHLLSPSGFLGLVCPSSIPPACRCHFFFPFFFSLAPMDL